MSALSPEQIAEAAAQYATGVSTKKLGKQFGVSRKMMVKLLVESGTQLRPKVGKSLTPEQIAEAITQYAAVWRWLKRAGVQIRPTTDSHKRLVKNETAFDTLTPESAYWIGMLITDGCVKSYHNKSGDPNVLQLTLQLRDLDHLLAFRSFLEADNKVWIGWTHGGPEHRERRTRVCQLVITSRKLATALTQYGVVPNKTLTVVAQGGAEQLTSFWTGAVDGDGGLGVTVKGMAYIRLTSASRVFIEQFASFLKAHGVHTTASVTSRLTSSGRLQYDYALSGWPAIEAAKLLYTNSPVVLARKRAHAETLFDRATTMGKPRVLHSVAWAVAQGACNG